MNVKVIGYGIIVFVAGTVQAMDSQEQQSYHSPSPTSPYTQSLPQRRKSNLSPDHKAALLYEQLILILERIKSDNGDILRITGNDKMQQAFIKQLIANGYTSDYLHDMWHTDDETRRRQFIAAVAVRAEFFLQHAEHVKGHAAVFGPGNADKEGLQFDLELD